MNSSQVVELINLLNNHATKNWEIRFHGNLVDINYPDSPTTPDYEDYTSLSEALAEVVRDCEKNIVRLPNGSQIVFSKTEPQDKLRGASRPL